MKRIISSHWQIIAIVLLAGILLSVNINKPFIGHHDWNGAFWGSVTRNYLGWLYELVGKAKWAEVDSQHAGSLWFYHSYSPLMPILFTLSSLAFGLSEVSMRLVTVLYSLAMVVYLYKLVSFVYSQKVALIAGVLMIFTPMFLYFGKLPDHEPIVGALAVIALYYYVKNAVEPAKYRIQLAVFLLLMLLESWGGFFLLGLMFIHSLVVRRSLKTSALLAAAGIGVVVIQTTLLIANGGVGAVISLANKGLFRMNVGQNQNGLYSFTLLQFVKTEFQYSSVYFTRTLVVLAAFFVLLFFVRACKQQVAVKEYPVIFLGVYASLFILVFKNLAFIHDYKLYLLLPFLSIAAAKTIDTIAGKIKNPYFAKALIGLAIVAVALERKDFLITQIYSTYNRPGYELGKKINQLTAVNEKVLVSSREFDEFYGVFLRFYANRQIDTRDLQVGDLENPAVLSQYKYIVFVDGRPTNQDAFIKLASLYPSVKNDVYTLIKLD